MRNVEGAKAGSNQKKPYRAPVSVTSTQRMRIKYGISEGTIRGFSAEFSHNEMLKRIYLDGTPIMSSEGEQLLDVVVEFRDGSRDQEPINGLPSISVEHDVGVEVKIAAPVSRSFDRSDTTSYDVRISVPTLYQGDDEGNSRKGLIQFKIDVSTDGGAFEEAGRFEIYEKILNGFAETYNVVVPKGSNHVVRISRLNSEVVSDYSVNRLVVEAITENTDVRLRYTNTAVLYLEYDAEQFSNVPKLEMRVFGKNDILVPANYNGDTHTYATSGAGTTNGVWDGTWKRAYTDNPVWISLDLMISRRYGLGDKIDLTFINKWELYGLAQYCDEAVADGKGGFEPRFTCNNMYLQKSEDAYRVLKDLAASFRAKVVWDGEFITLQADVPRDPVHTFSNANASDITYSSTQDSAQRNLINVQYYDRDNKFASDVVMQRSNSNILSRGKVVDGNFTALGCASQGQAQRIASYVMNTELYETELVSFTTGLEGGLVRLNDVIQMADNSVAGQTVGGRIAAVNGRSITLDRKIPDNVQAIATTQLSINRQDVKNEPISIISISDDRMTAVLASDAPAGTEAGLVWALITQDLVPQKFVVTDIEFDSTNMTFALSAIQYNESKYAAIDGSARIVVPPISVTEYKMLKAPIIVIASYLTRIIQDAVVCDIDVSWAQSNNAVQYQLEMQKAGSDWRIVGRFMSLATTLDNMYTGTYTFRVCAYDSLGNASQYTYSDPILVAGKVLPPPALAQYSVVGILFGYQHKWIYPAHTEDSRAVRLRFTTIDPVASPSQDWQYIDVAYPTATFTEQDVSAGLRTWFSAAIVDKYGNVGAYTVWQSAVPSVDATQVLDLLDGQLTAQQLDQDLTNKIAIGAEAAEAAESAQNAAAAAAQAAANAQTAANGASVAASNAQTTASNAQTAANTAKTAAATAQTSANNAAASVNALATEVDADITALSTDLNAKLTTLGNGLTQETTDRQNADTQIVGQLNAYKTSNDAAVAGVLQKAEAATTASTANSQALTNLTATVNTKNRTYRQTTAPTAGRVVGDLWINTTAGKNNEVRRWNGTAWDDLTDPRTAANATALTNLQTTVTAIDGRTTANANSITQLSTDLTTLSNNVDAKADASAVDSLTTRVSTAEGNITSQGTRVTNLENTVNHATTGLASKASSSALTAVDNKVTAANGRIDTTNSNVTTLTGRVSTVEGAVSTKAEASALTALTTRVTNAEGVNTSQGTAITTLQNTVNHATTGLATKASTSALTATNSEVTRINGVVTGHTNQLTQLASDITTINGNLATKADASALNDIYTKTQADAKATEIAAGQVADYSANLKIGGDNLIRNGNFAGGVLSKWGAWGSAASADRTVEQVGNKYFAHLVGKDTSVFKGISQSNVKFERNTEYVISFVAYSNADNQKASFLIHQVATNNDPQLYLQSPVLTSIATTYELRFKSADVDKSHFTFMLSGTNGTAYDIYITDIMLQTGTKATAWAESYLDAQESTDANASAIVTTNAEVSRINGVVTSQGTSITNLQAGLTTANNNIALKADGAALTALTTRVTSAEGNITSQGSRVTSLENAVNHATTGLSTKASSAALTTLDNKVTAIDGRVTSNSSSITSLNNSLTTTNTNVTAAQTAATNAMTAAGQKGKVIFGTTAPVAADQLSQNLWIDTTGNANTPKRWNGTAWVVVTDKVATDALAAANAASSLAATKADSSALTALDSKVTTIDGKVTTNASNITTLQGKVTTVENGLSTKADGSALTALTTRVANAEGSLTTQSSKTTALEAKISSFKAAGRNYLLASKAAGSKSVNPEINTILAPSTPIRMSFDIEIKTPVQAGSRNRIGFECNYAIAGTTYYCGVWLDNASSAGAGKRRVYFTHWLPSSWTAGVSAFPSTFLYYNQTSGGDFTVSNIKLEVGDAYTDWTPAPEDNASASALSTLDTKVTSIDGRVTSQATSLSTLSTTVGNNTAAIQLQQSSIDGINAKATLQVEAGGVVGGVALGNNGGVVDFIMRVNTFAIAPPVSAGAGDAGKYAFNYRSTPLSLPNGTVVPSGLYLDNAIIDYVHASRIYAENLSVITANIGTFVTLKDPTKPNGARMIIQGSLIRVYDDNNVMRVRLGLWDL